jgi:dGTPase
LVETTAKNVAARAPNSIDELRLCPPLAGFSPALLDENREMKRFLRTQLYRHYQVLRMTNKAKRIIEDLFSAFLSDPRLLPPQYLNAENQPRAVADYVAGMTDRYAMREHRRLFAVGEI